MARNLRLDPEQVRQLLTESRGRIAPVARALGANHSTICYWRVKLGIPKGDRGRKADPARVRELHACNLSDTDVAAQLGCTSSAVAACRVRLGLPPNGKSSASYVAKMRAHYRNRCLAVGVRSLRSLNPDTCSDARKRLAAQYGLPTDLYPQQVRIVLILTAGPLTAAQIADQIGRGMRGVNPYHRLNCAGCAGGNYLGDLCRRGLVAHIADGKTRVYSLTATALELLSGGNA